MTSKEEKEINTELLALDIWENWLSSLVQFITSFEGQIDVVGMLGQIKMKVEDCSRCYTGMWTLDMLHQAWEKNNMKLPAAFKTGLDKLQADWNCMMMPIRDTRKILLGEKCIHYFVTNFKDWQKVISKPMLDHLTSTCNASDAWNNICKLAADNGWNGDKEYKKFLAKLMIAMTKY